MNTIFINFEKFKFDFFNKFILKVGMKSVIIIVDIPNKVTDINLELMNGENSYINAIGIIAYGIIKKKNNAIENRYFIFNELK